jgi:hypothetical protein
MVNYALLPLNLTTSDCTFIQGFLAFLAWTQLNDRAVAQATSLGYVPLPFGYKTYAVLLHLCVRCSITRLWCISPYRTSLRRLIDLMGNIHCNQDRAFTITWLIGEGLSFNLYTVWMAEYLSGNIRLRYFQNPTSIAISDMGACMALPSHVLISCATFAHYFLWTPFFAGQTTWTLAASALR